MCGSRFHSYVKRRVSAMSPPSSWISAASVFGYGKSAIRERSFKNGRLEKTLPFIGFREPA